MARPKIFPNHQDKHPHLRDPRGHVPAGLAIEADSTRLVRQAKALIHPTPAGINDPASVACVVDLLLRLDHDTTIRARHLSNLLDVEYQNFLWNPVVVGRILGELVQAAEAVDPRDPPIVVNLGQYGNRFVVRESEAAWRWLLGIREALGTAAEEAIRTERQIGTLLPRTNFPFDVIESVKYAADEEEAA